MKLRLTKPQIDVILTHCHKYNPLAFTPDYFTSVENRIAFAGARLGNEPPGTTAMVELEPSEVEEIRGYLLRHQEELETELKAIADTLPAILDVELADLVNAVSEAMESDEPA